MFKQEFALEFSTMIKEVITYSASVFGRTAWFGYVGAAIVAFLTPITPIMHAMSALIILDTITGVCRTYREGDKKYKWGVLGHINSAGLGRTLNKFLAYFILIISAYIVGKYILPVEAGVVLAKSMASLMAGRELLSIGENVGKSSIVVDFIKKLQDKLKG